MTATEHCSQDLELIATYVDGDLKGEEKERLEEHLAVCESCRELVAEAVQLVHGDRDQEGARLSAASHDTASRGVIELAEQRGAEPGSPPSSHRADTSKAPVTRWLAAAAAITVVVLGAWWGLRQLSPPMTSSAQVAYLPSDKQLAGLLGVELIDGRWSGNRGANTVTASPVAAFQLGVHSVDAAAALQTGRLDTALIVTYRIGELLASIDGPIGGQLQLNNVLLQTSLESAAASPPGTDNEALQLARDFDELLNNVEPAAYVTLGRWAAVGHLAALSKTSAFFTSPQWRTGLKLLQDSRPTGNLEPVPYALAQLAPTQFDELGTELEIVLLAFGNGRETLGVID